MLAPTHRHLEVDGVRVFYRESHPDRDDAPVLLLLHGFPSGSHQFRRLIEMLGGRYRLIAPDYPGFGHTEVPDGFVYSFDRLADITEGFVRGLGLDRFVMYAFDFGVPVGFRVAERHPEWIAGLIVQNGNAYEEGLSDAARDLITLTAGVLPGGGVPGGVLPGGGVPGGALPPDALPPGAREAVDDLLTLTGTRGQYVTGVAHPDLIAPDGWTLDQHFLDLPGRKDAQRALMSDYRSNVERYPRWQAWLRRHTPPTLIAWGRGDPFFTEAAAHAYLRDLPGAELHLFDTGHFALETHLPQIAPLIADFLDRAWKEQR